MCANCYEGICQRRCVAEQQRGYRGEIIPSECILFGEPDPLMKPEHGKTNRTSTDASRRGRGTQS